jgi:hypothetical protein
MSAVERRGILEGKELTAATRALIACREKSASVDNLKRPIVPGIDPN